MSVFIDLCPWPANIRLCPLFLLINVSVNWPLHVYSFVPSNSSCSSTVVLPDNVTQGHWLIQFGRRCLHFYLRVSISLVEVKIMAQFYYAPFWSDSTGDCHTFVKQCRLHWKVHNPHFKWSIYLRFVNFTYCVRVSSKTINSWCFYCQEFQFGDDMNTNDLLFATVGPFSTSISAAGLASFLVSSSISGF